MGIEKLIKKKIPNVVFQFIKQKKKNQNFWSYHLAKKVPLPKIY